MNETANMFLLEEEKFMSEMYLKWSRFTHSACWSLAKNIERIQKIIGTGDLYIYQKELDKACLKHDIAYWEFKNLPRRIW